MILSKKPPAFSKGEGHTYPCNLNPSAVVTAARTFKILIVWLGWLSSSHMRQWLVQRDRGHWRTAMESRGWESGGERIFKATCPRWWTDKMQRYQWSNWEKKISKRIRKRTLGMKRIKNKGFVVMGLVVMAVEFSLIWHYLPNTWWCDLGIQKIWHFIKRLFYCPGDGCNVIFYHNHIFSQILSPTIVIIFSILFIVLTQLNSAFIAKSPS